MQYSLAKSKHLKHRHYKVGAAKPSRSHLKRKRPECNPDETAALRALRKEKDQLSFTIQNLESKLSSIHEKISAENRKVEEKSRESKVRAKNLASRVQRKMDLIVQHHKDIISAMKELEEIYRHSDEESVQDLRDFARDIAFTMDRCVKENAAIAIVADAKPYNKKASKNVSLIK